MVPKGGTHWKHPRSCVKSGPFSVRSVVWRNKTRTSKVGALSKAQKAQNIFLKTKIFSFGKCRIVPKNVKEGTLWDLLIYIQLQNIKNLEGGPF